MQIIPNQIGEALSTGLNQLAQHKLGQLSKQYEAQSERNQFAQGVAPQLGQDTANFLSYLSPKERELALNNISFLAKLNQQPGQAQPAMSALQQPGQQQPGQQQEQKAQQQEQLTPERAKLLEEIFTSPQERREREKLELQKKGIQSKEDLAAWANTKAYREKVLNTEQSARESLDAIKEAQALEKSGEFPSQQFAAFLKGSEWEDVPGFLSGSAEAYNKILANFQRGAKEIYGGRITNFEMEQFLKTIPSLQQTPEGRSRIWSMMKNYYRSGKEYAKVERQVIKDNRGVPPQDLHEKVNEKFKPIAKDLSKRFKKDLEEAQKLQSSYASRLGSIGAYGLGKAANAIPGILKGGAKGAITGGLAGSVIPGIGTGLGALGGGALGALGGNGGLSDILKLLL